MMNMDAMMDEAETQDTPPAEDSEGGQTYVLPKDCARGKSVGDTITVRIVGDHEDSFEVEPTTTEEVDTEPEMESEMKAPADAGAYDMMD